MPTQRDQLLDLFRRNGNQLTLGQILQHPYGYEARARFTELRRDGYVIAFTRGKTPSENTYRMLEPEPSGQLRLA